MKTFADMSWEQKSRGNLPPVGVTYDDWIQCQPSFPRRKTALCDQSLSTGDPPGKRLKSALRKPLPQTDLR